MQMPSNFKPEYIDPAGKEAISFKPPILFRNVTARVFPLKSEYGAVETQFCDQYLNMDIPPEIVQFNPGAAVCLFHGAELWRHVCRVPRKVTITFEHPIADMIQHVAFLTSLPDRFVRMALAMR
jgi:hypothetical protein